MGLLVWMSSEKSIRSGPKQWHVVARRSTKKLANNCCCDCSMTAICLVLFIWYVCVCVEPKHIQLPGIRNPHLWTQPIIKSKSSSRWVWASTLLLFELPVAFGCVTRHWKLPRMTTVDVSRMIRHCFHIDRVQICLHSFCCLACVQRNGKCSIGWNPSRLFDFLLHIFITQWIYADYWWPSAIACGSWAIVRNDLLSNTNIASNATLEVAYILLRLCRCCRSADRQAFDTSLRSVCVRFVMLANLLCSDIDCDRRWKYASIGHF